jgi:hypothetical protein
MTKNSRRLFRSTVTITSPVSLRRSSASNRCFEPLALYHLLSTLHRKMDFTVVIEFLRTIKSAAV